MTGFAELRARMRTEKGRCLCVAGGNDASVIKAVVMAIRHKLVSHVLITGDTAEIRSHLPSELTSRIDLIDATDALACANFAVNTARSGMADILMKGHIDSGAFLSAIVQRDTGIRQSSVLSNVTVAEMPSYPKFIAATDNGIIPAPTLEQKRKIILNTAPLYRGLNTAPVHVAALAASEKISKSMPATAEASQLSEESFNGGLTGFVVDGPFGYDVAVSASAANKKGFNASKVAGQADLLLFPSIEAANAVAKAWKYHGQAATGSLVLGAKVPVLLNSRSDSPQRRLNSLLLALAAQN